MIRGFMQRLGRFGGNSGGVLAGGCWQATAHLFWLEATLLLGGGFRSTANAAQKDMPFPA